MFKFSEEVVAISGNLVKPKEWIEGKFIYCFWKWNLSGLENFLQAKTYK